MNETSSRLNRRQFLGASSAAALLTFHHGQAQQRSTPASPAPARNKEPRIVNLELATAAPLARMKDFYSQSLGFQVIDDRVDRLTLAAGQTQLTFLPAANDAGQPFYHYAFNIPENKIAAALKWQKARSGILPVPESLRDSDYPEEVVNYRHWNAHSIFFFDPAQNIVEYIARHGLKNSQAGPFESRDILYASEIAFVVDDVQATASTLGQAAGVGQYLGGNELFTAMGDEHGLLLVMKRGRLLSLASPQKKEAAVHRTTASIRATQRTQHSIVGFPYTIKMEA